MYHKTELIKYSNLRKNIRKIEEKSVKMARWNSTYIQSKIEQEEKLYKYRSKLRRPQCINHVMNIRSQCAQCRAEFWKDCRRIMLEETTQPASRHEETLTNQEDSKPSTGQVKEQPINMVNVIKSER